MEMSRYVRTYRPFLSFLFQDLISSHLILHPHSNLQPFSLVTFHPFRMQLRHLLQEAFLDYLGQHDFKVPTAYANNLWLGGVAWVIFKLSIDHLSQALLKH